MSLEAGLEPGTNVVISSPGHRCDGFLGVIEYYSQGFGTYGVSFGEMGTFGFYPSEVKATDQ